MRQFRLAFARRPAMFTIAREAKNCWPNSSDRTIPDDERA
jgi:hypothetical protein